MTAAARAILFDLDGTLIDTAPDMVRVLAEMLDSHGQPALPYDLVRSTVSNGSLGLIRLGFPDADDQHSNLQQEYLDRYERDVCRDSVVFPDLPELLDELEHNDRAWGVVTNKPDRMTRPLLDALGLLERAACIVCGDTLPQRKPDPAPLLLASELTGVPSAECLYVGDASRDIEAGRAAGMRTVAAGYGYIVAGDHPDRWQADLIAPDTRELAQIVRKAVSLAV